MKHIDPPVMPDENATDEQWEEYAKAELAHEKRTRIDPLIPWALLAAGILGLLAAVKLTLGKITYWQNLASGESTILGCDINPIVGCGTALNSDQGSIFGSIPNPIIGIIGWSLIIFFSVLVFSKVKLREWHWMGLQAGVIFGLGIVTYLQYQSIYNLYVLCPWCMATWLATVPLFWLVTANNLRRWAHDSKLSKLVYQWYGLFIVVHIGAICLAAWIKFGSAIFA